MLLMSQDLMVGNLGTQVKGLEYVDRRASSLRQDENDRVAFERPRLAFGPCSVYVGHLDQMRSGRRAKPLALTVSSSCLSVDRSRFLASGCNPRS